MVNRVDWSKAKTILIVAFIITNILLVYVLMEETKIEEPTINADFIEDVINLLKMKNISVDTDIPTDIPYLNTMIVKYEKFNLEELNKKFFNGRGSIIKDEEGLGEIECGDDNIIIINNKIIKYENKSENELYKELDKDRAIKIAEEFMKKRQWNVSDMELTFFKEQDDIYYLEYSKTYEDYFIEKAYTNFQIDKRGVKKFERLWLKSGELGDIKINISTAPKAILGLLDMKEAYGKTIADISLCYYFDPEKHSYLEDLGEAKQGKAVPAWRIQFDDGYKVLLDEYK